MRVRHAGGACTLSVESGCSLQALYELIHHKTGAKAASVLHGFPPTPLTDVAALRSGDSLQVVAEDAPAASPAAPQPAPAATPPAAPSALPNGIAMHSGEAVVRRIIADDNSCCFNAVGYSVLRSRSEAPHLRELIASTVAAEQEEYCEAVLNKSTAAYQVSRRDALTHAGTSALGRAASAARLNRARFAEQPSQLTFCVHQAWIREPNSWGGGIELSILSKHFGIEIHAADIQTCRIDRYGEGGGFTARILLLFDGLHYDACTVAAALDAPEDFDTTMLPVEGAEVDAAFAALVKAHHDAGQFTNTSTFSLRCLVCRAGMTGEREATAHAKSTGHTSFGEYR